MVVGPKYQQDPYGSVVPDTGCGGQKKVLLLWTGRKWMEKTLGPLSAPGQVKLRMPIKAV